MVDDHGWGGGLTLLWRNAIQIQLLSRSQCHIDCEVAMANSPSWRLTGIYREPRTKLRKHVWSPLMHLSKINQALWLCVGDFNEIFYIKKKIEDVLQLWCQIEEFRMIVQIFRLFNLGYQGQITLGEGVKI